MKFFNSIVTLCFFLPTSLCAVFEKGEQAIITEGRYQNTPVQIWGSNKTLFAEKTICELGVLEDEKLKRYVYDFLKKRAPKYEELVQEVYRGTASDKTKNYFLKECDGRFYQVISLLDDKEIYIHESSLQLQKFDRDRSSTL